MACAALQPLLANQQNPIPAAAPQAPNVQQPPQQPAAYRQQPQQACFHCGDPSHFVADCPLKDRARKPEQQAISLCRINTESEWICPSNLRGMNDDDVPAALPGHGTAAFCVNCGRTGHVASECMVPKNATTEEQVKAACYAPVTNSAEFADPDNQIRVISTSEERGPSRPVVGDLR